MLKKDGILLNLKKERQILMLFSSRILFVVLTYTNDHWCWQFYTLRKTWGFSERHYSLKDFSCFFGVFWSWLKDRISLSERLVIFFILKDFQLIQKDLLFLILKDSFHQKDLDVKERHEFLFSERLVVVIFFRKTCNFFQKDF